MTARRTVIPGVDWVLFLAVALTFVAMVRYAIFGMLGDGIALLGTAVSLIGVWIGARHDRRHNGS